MMKRIGLIVVAALMSVPAAFAYNGEDYPMGGKDAALRACSKINTDYSRLDCIKAVERADFIDADIVPLCDSITTAYSTVDCMNKVANKYFMEEAVKVCKRITVDYSKIECATTIADKSFSYGMLAACDKMSTAYGTIDCLKQGSNGAIIRPRPPVGCDPSRPNQCHPNPIPNPRPNPRPDCTESSYMNRVRGALGNLRGGNLDAAERTLENLRDQLNRCM